MKDYSNALSYYEKTFEIQQKSLQSDHPLLAYSYSTIVEAYYSLGEYTTAVSYYEKTIAVR
jgi:tetratricopeptide (TPR) repeat protein